ncbi:MAG: hypothetical protein HY815_27430, partial [Candidatus Riflebacteria bacterium]|nr:hypothetical protein [Candidatus Riflebacteria bacterium]
MGLALRNDSPGPVAARSLVRFDDLPADIVGPGSVDEPAVWQPGRTLPQRLAVFIPDAMQEASDVPVIPCARSSPMMRQTWILGAAALGAVVVAAVVAGIISFRPTPEQPPPPEAKPDLADAPAAPRPPVMSPVSLAESAKRLYAGKDVRQNGVLEGAIDEVRAAILHGVVRSRDGGPLADVKLSVRDHPEFGATVSRGDGGFEMAVNGGGQLCIRYEKDGYLPLFRSANVPWQDHAWLPDVVLITADPHVTPIDLKAPTPIQVARGDVVKDPDGERQATLLIPQGTRAEMTRPDGAKQELTSLAVRLTEYSVGGRGVAAMPAPLPPSSGYTYCFELTADEVTRGGVKVNGRDLLLSKPAVFYLDNFLKFPPGISVPTGYYDNHAAAWVASTSGRVIKILAVRNGLADLDVEGQDQPSDAAVLGKLGITEAERRQLASLYKPGHSLWRVEVPHFSTWDCNWGFRPPSDAEDPNSETEGDPDAPPCMCPP